MIIDKNQSSAYVCIALGYLNAAQSEIPSREVAGMGIDGKVVYSKRRSALDRLIEHAEEYLGGNYEWGMPTDQEGE